LNDYYQGPHGRWRGTWKHDGGGSLSNQGIHTVDLVQWIAGPVHSVCGFFGVFNHKIEAEDQVVAILKFENGALGTLLTTTCTIPDQPLHLHMYGTKGSYSRKADLLEFYEMGTPKERERMMRLFGGERLHDTAGVDPLALSTDGHKRLVEDLVAAVRNGRDPAITIDSASRSVEIVHAIYRSGRTGREVKVGEMRK
jgi:predicted dehydrogenase